MLNLFITILNKTVFQFLDFEYPMALTAMHMLCSGIGSWVSCYILKVYEPAKLDMKREGQMFAFSLLFTANIIFGNVSLRYVSVPFNQVMRATVPGATMLLSWMFLQQTFSLERKLSMVLVSMGVVTACYGDLDFTWFGFWITNVAVAMAALKVVVSSWFLTGDLKLHPIDLLNRMSWLALVQSLFFAYQYGEIDEIRERWDAFGASDWMTIWATGVISFFLNISSFYVNQVTSALTLTVVGNVKQVAVIVLSVFIFNNPITLVNSIGVFIVILGGAYYSYVGFNESKPAAAPKKSNIVV